MSKMITDIPGVFANGIHCGIKPRKKDLAFIYVPNACASAGVFTQSHFAASSVVHTRKAIKNNTLKAILVNSGNANAATGERGIRDNKAMVGQVAKILGLSVNEVGVGSTGIIGVPMPMDKVKAGIDELFEDKKAKNGQAVAEAIMTTDAFMKTVFAERKIGGQTVVVAGMSKGAGMIAPNMATTLTYFVTNLLIDQRTLQTILTEVNDDTFNMISVDTDTSTNDMVVILATGEKRFTLTNALKEEFKELLFEACLTLAKMLVQDGEGATRVIEMQVNGATKRSDARRIAKNVIESPLVKTAIHGSDPNWGRVVMAASKNPDVKLNPEKVDLFFGDYPILKKGQLVPFSRPDVVEYLKNDLVRITLDLNLGKSNATAWGSDLTKKYIDINTAYN